MHCIYCFPALIRVHALMQYALYRCMILLRDMPYYLPYDCSPYAHLYSLGRLLGLKLHGFSRAGFVSFGRLFRPCCFIAVFGVLLFWRSPLSSQFGKLYTVRCVLGYTLAKVFGL